MRFNMTARVLLACILGASLLASAGCAKKAAMAPEETKTIPAEPAPAPAVELEPAPEPEPRGPLTSDEIIAAFKNGGLPVGTVEIYDASTDPNELLGRPGQYTAKLNFADTGLEQYGESLTGGSLESFSSEKDLQNRVDYIKSITESMPGLVEYQYVNGLMLLRLDKGLTPDQAAAYDTVFQGLGK